MFLNEKSPWYPPHSQASRESFPGLCKNYAARKRVFSVSMRFAPFILPVFMGWGKRQIPLISPWLASVILQNFEFPHPFPSNSKQCREFSPAQGQRSQFIPLYSPTYSPGWPGVLPQGQADDMCITWGSDWYLRSLSPRSSITLTWRSICSQRVLNRVHTSNECNF